jgi:hypothetical protein
MNRKASREKERIVPGQLLSTRTKVTAGCNFCRQRLERQLKNRKALSPDLPVSVLFTSVGVGVVQFKFVDTEDGMSEWTYWLWSKFAEKERKKIRKRRVM